MFQNKQEIENLIKKTDDYDLTQEIITKIEQLKKIRPGFYLTLEELEEIFKWKLRTQFGRQKAIREKNTESNIKIITGAAFAISHPDKKIEITLKLKALSLIYGVEIPVASAILTLCFPKEYSVIDFRNWRQIFREEDKKSSYTATEYIKYLEIIKEISEKFNFTTQEIDLAIWQKDVNEFG